MKARAACRQKGSECWEHCAASNPKRHFRWRKRREMHFLPCEEEEIWIEVYVENETAVRAQQVHDAETAVVQAPEDMSTTENAGGTTSNPEKVFQEMLNAIRDSLSDLLSSDDEQDEEDEEDDEEDTELSKRSHDDEPGWVMGTISKTVKHRIESLQQKQMTLEELTHPGRGDAANFCRERNMLYGTPDFKVPTVVKPKIDMTAATPSLTTFGEQLQTLHIVC